MKVKDLIETLSHYDPNTDVMILQPTHNYWRDEIAVTPESAFAANVGYSEYNHAYQYRNDEDYSSDDIKHVVLIG